MNQISSSRHVLLIEDDVVDHIIISRALEEYKDAHFICEHVRMLADIPNIIEQNKFDIIISDMDLPDSNGLDTIRSLIGMVGQIPVIVLSGSEDKTLATESVQVGAQDFIPKRYVDDTGLIVRSVTHAIERNQLRLGLEKTRDQAYFLAHYDQTTKLPNRVLFLEKLNYSTAHAARTGNKVSLCFIDLDGFKLVNDTIGHDAGDEVLRCVSKRMKSLLRESDLIARIGGDEFVVLLHNIHNQNDLNTVTQKLIQTINEPIEYDGKFSSVGASIGVATYPSHADSAECLLKHADLAMYHAKHNGKNQSCIFTNDLLKEKDKNLSLQSKLLTALEQPDKYFALFYQPRVALEDESIHSVEALIRWRDEELGFIAPDQFIPLAENLNIIHKIDQWVIEQACKKIVDWQAIKKKIRVGINISGQSFNSKGFVSNVVEPLLNAYNITGELLEIEITESILLEDLDNVYQQLLKLKNLGITIAIDDFGTGFSSLGYLSKLPIDTLKIDGSFICDANSDHSDQIVLKAIVALGKALELTVVAECIETESQRLYLKSLHCTEGQGYFWTKPIENWQPIRHTSRK